MRMLWTHPREFVDGEGIVPHTKSCEQCIASTSQTCEVVDGEGIDLIRTVANASRVLRKLFYATYRMYYIFIYLFIFIYL